jgi:hypothetical protein
MEEKKRKLQDQQEEDKENNSTSVSTLIVAYGASDEVSPLTSSSETSRQSNDSGSSAATSRGKLRLSSRQASVARLQAKEENQSYDGRFKAAFKEATNQLAAPNNLEPVTQMIARLNEQFDLSGKRKLYR